MSFSTDETQIRVAEFNRDVRKYWLLTGVWILCISVIGIPLIPIWWLVGLGITQKWLDRMECILTDRSLIVRKGVLNRIEKTVPLDKITDLGLKQGPIMRYLKIEQMTIETAGQSAQGALVNLIGIQDAISFRNAVLKQRKLVLGTSTPTIPQQTEARVDGSHDVLIEIRDSLGRIENALTRSREADA